MTALLTTPDFRPDHWLHDTQTLNVAPEPLSPQAIVVTTPMASPPAGDRLCRDCGTALVKKPGPGRWPTRCAECKPITSGSSHPAEDTHPNNAAAGTNFPAGGEQDRDGSATTIGTTTTIVAPSLADPFLALAADVLDDAERNRIANENRLRQLTRTAADSDGEERGFGLDETHPDVARLAAIVELLGQVERQATRNLEKMLRKHPLGPWVKAQKGIGDKQAARLLAVIGDPYLGPDREPRTVSQLWAYCGHGDPTRRRFKGMTQADLFNLGSPIAKTRIWNIATSCLKAQGHYADVYYARKTVTEGRTHARDCVRCGPSGKPALAGTPWSDAHRHADALRVTGKAILRDLWREAKHIHETGEPR